MITRLAARMVGDLPEAKTRHYVGPPPQLTGGIDKRRVLPVPTVLIIESEIDGVLLHRYAADSSSAGDTWHVSIGEAKEQAKYEYGEAISPWTQIPEHVEDFFGFALK